jgi:hypothetical protein
MSWLFPTVFSAASSATACNATLTTLTIVLSASTDITSTTPPSAHSAQITAFNVSVLISALPALLAIRYPMGKLKANVCSANPPV